MDEKPVINSHMSVHADPGGIVKVTISDDSGNVVGSFEAQGATMWRDLLMYASERWEAQARSSSILALEEILASHRG